MGIWNKTEVKDKTNMRIKDHKIGCAIKFIEWQTEVFKFKTKTENAKLFKNQKKMQVPMTAGGQPFWAH